jgi:excisionase family DNA binding protein
MGFSFNTKSDFLGDYITVRTAAEISGYNQQYLRRLLRDNTFRSKRLGQIWLIDRNQFMDHLLKIRRSNDKRVGPQKNPTDS